MADLTKEQIINYLSACDIIIQYMYYTMIDCVAYQVRNYWYSRTINNVYVLVLYLRYCIVALI